MSNAAVTEESQDKECLTVDLHYIGGGSDKTYHLLISPAGNDLYDVLFAYGRRGSRLTRSCKTKGGPVPYEKAKAIYEKELKGQLRDGYQYAPGIAGQVFDIPASPTAPQGQPWAPTERIKTGINPQLLLPKTEDDIEYYITNPDYCGQPKYDGDRLAAKSDGSTKVQGTTKKGLATEVSPTVTRNILALGLPLTLDSEIIGETLYIFSLFEADGTDYTNRPYRNVLARLEQIFANHKGNGVKLAETAYTEEEKRALYHRLKAQDKEGIVFKSLSAPYSAKRSNNQVKVKFYATASVLVTGINDKSSVKVAVYLADNDTTSDLVPVGNITIPQGKPMPAEGTVIEVRYIYAFRGGALYHTTYLRPRKELDPGDCWIGQLKYKAEEDDEE